MALKKDLKSKIITKSSKYMNNFLP